MMILFRHNDTAQVIIHTANMIAKDWTNMTNAVWKTPQLAKLPESAFTRPEEAQTKPLGTGDRFKADLLEYLRQYDIRRATCRPLRDKLRAYDFSGVKAALVASVPGKHDSRNQSQTPWGWYALKRHLSSVPCNQGAAEVVAQVSSIATLGAQDDWLQKTLFDSMTASQTTGLSRPRFKVVFPTADEIRRSLDGYASGGSIHTKIQSAQQAKQLAYLRPIFHHWNNDSIKGKGKCWTAFGLVMGKLRRVDLPVDVELKDGSRGRAAPHVKTYIRYNNSSDSIDWALLTSANISKQAWGEAARANGEVRISSWEIGVLLWPNLLEPNSIMVGAFQRNVSRDVAGREPSLARHSSDEVKAVTGLRIPYSLPLQQYGDDEIPWVASARHAEPDWLGRIWDGWK